MPYSFFAITGIIGGIAFMHEGLSWLIFVYALLLLHAVVESSSWKEVAKGTLLTGSLKTGVATWWMINALPLTWLTDASFFLQCIVFFLTWLGIALTIGCGTLCAGLLVFSVRKYKTLRYFAYALFFVCADLLGALIFSLYAYAPGHPPNFSFGFSMVGYVLADHSLLSFVATFGGLITLSLCLGVCASITHFVYHQYNRSQSIYVGAVVLYLLTSFIPVHYLNETTNTRIIAGIKTDFDPEKIISQEDTLVRQEYFNKAIKKAHQAGAELILLPESAGLTAYKSEFRVLANLKKELGSGVVVDVTNITTVHGSAIQRSFTYDLNQNEVYISDKSYTTPIGEYLPLGHYVISRLFGMKEIDTVAIQERSRIEIPTDAGSHIPAVLFCFESSSPFIALKKGMERDMKMMVHPASHSWFRSPYTYWHQERQMLKVHARSTGLPILQTTNKGPALLFLPNGQATSGKTLPINEFVEVVVFGR